MAALSAAQAFALLQAKAGPFAGRVARVWPAPHDEYMTLPDVKRHLAHVCLRRVHATHAGRDAGAFRRDLARRNAKAFLAKWKPEAPKGFLRALEKLGPAFWKPADYRVLEALLAEGGWTAQAVQQMPAWISPQKLRAAVALPVRFRHHAITRWLTGPSDARAVNEAIELIGVVRGERFVKERAFLDTLRKAPTRAAFFRALAEAARPKALPTPLPGTARLRPLATVKDVEAAGLRFRNCLSDHVDDACFRGAVFFEWTGEEPAVMEVTPEGVAGWRLQELRGMANADPSPATRKAIHRELQDMGVRVASSGAEGVISELLWLADGH